MADQGQQSSGLDPKVASLLCYLCGWVTGLIFILIEKQNKDVRFHAWQAFFFGLAGIAIYVVLMVLTAILPLLTSILSLVVWLGLIVLWVILMVKAYQGERFKLPVIGDLAEKQAG